MTKLIQNINITAFSELLSSLELLQNLYCRNEQDTSHFEVQCYVYHLQALYLHRFRSMQIHMVCSQRYMLLPSLCHFQATFPNKPLLKVQL